MNFQIKKTVPSRAWPTWTLEPSTVKPTPCEILYIDAGIVYLGRWCGSVLDKDADDRYRCHDWAYRLRRANLALHPLVERVALTKQWGRGAGRRGWLEKQPQLSDKEEKKIKYKNTNLTMRESEIKLHNKKT